MSVTSMITDGIRRHEVLLPINHNRYNFRKKQIHLEQTYAVETLSQIKDFFISEIPHFFFFFFFCRISSYHYGYCDQYCDWWIKLSGLSKIDCFSRLIVGVRPQATVQLHSLITTVQNDQLRIKQPMHQSQLRKL